MPGTTFGLTPLASYSAPQPATSPVSQRYPYLRSLSAPGADGGVRYLAPVSTEATGVDAPRCTCKTHPWLNLAVSLSGDHPGKGYE